MLLKIKYHLHLFLKKHNEALMQDALCEKLRAKLSERARYHSNRAMILTAKTE
ncbi:hypothetical protein AB5I83_09125 [Mesobacillus sp. LC4]